MSVFKPYHDAMMADLEAEKKKGKQQVPTKETINALCTEVHEQNAKWWADLHTGLPIKRNVGELLMLVVSEIAEAMEGHRKNLPDDKLPHRSMLEVELADAVIRIFDISAGLGLDLGGAYVEKMAFNAQRIDHTREHRLGENGKKY
jgi:NTP pyrophosphatase (non-canonical NTP hydrolase)